MTSSNAEAAATQKGKAEAGARRFNYLNEEAIKASLLNSTPYDFTYIPNAIEERYKEEILLDAPVIPHRGSYGLPTLRRGPKFQAVIDDLLSDRFRQHRGREVRYRPFAKPARGSDGRPIERCQRRRLRAPGFEAQDRHRPTSASRASGHMSAASCAS